MKSSIYVTQPYIPSIEDYNIYLEKIWKSKILTNDGSLNKELKTKLSEYFENNHITLYANGTIPLQVILNTFGDTGEIITTPFSYVATTSSIIWERCLPVFVDIDDSMLTINEDLIEEKISSNTKAILATHVFGNPCNIDKLQNIARKYNLHLFFDNAHGFGVKYKNRHLCNYGDFSTFSFHSTKVFHTIEGGALVCNNSRFYGLYENKHNFGHLSPTEFDTPGINGKMSEFQAAMGLCLLKKLDHIFSTRKKIAQIYDELLRPKSFKTFQYREGCIPNHAYYPIIFDSKEILEKTLKILNKNRIYPRKYFFPSLNTLPYLSDYQPCPISEDISSRILCLPIYPTLKLDELEFIIRTINE